MHSKMQNHAYGIKIGWMVVRFVGVLIVLISLFCIKIEWNECEM